MEHDHMDSIRRNTRHFLATRYPTTNFRLGPDQPWRTGADFARHLDELDDDSVRVLADDCLDDLERGDTGLLTR